jgi:hypothetical protein
MKKIIKAIYDTWNYTTDEEDAFLILSATVATPRLTMIVQNHREEKAERMTVIKI